MVMSRKDFLRSHVLIWWRKVYLDWEDVTSSGRAFQVPFLAVGSCGAVTNLMEPVCLGHLGGLLQPNGGRISVWSVGILKGISSRDNTI